MEVSAPESALERKWKPTPKQKAFIALPFSIFEALYGGSAGTGKSELLVLLPLVYRFHEHPLFKGLIMRRTFPELEAEIIKRSAEWYPHAGGIYNESKKRWTFPSGAMIMFGHAEKESDVRKYDSLQLNYFAPDECTSFTQFQYEYIGFSRVRSRTPDLPAIIRTATNPGNIGHAYFRDRFVSPWKDGFKLIREKAGVDSKGEQKYSKRVFIPALPTDNPYLMESDPEYYNRLQMLPEAEKRAKCFGDWFTFSGQVFKEFRVEPLPNEPTNACHVIRRDQQFAIPSYWPRVIAIDWGYTAMTWIGWSAVSPDGRVYVYRSYAEKEKKTSQWITDLINITGHEKDATVLVRICHSANQMRGEPLTIIAQLQNELRAAGFKCRVELGERNRINGKMLIHDYLRWQPRTKIDVLQDQTYNQELADRIYRSSGEKAYKDYINLFTDPEPENNIPKLQIFEQCEELIDAIASCIYDDTNSDGKPPEDVKEFNGDDPYDGLRILLGGISDFLADKAKFLEAAKAIQDATNDLLNSGNVTAYYRKMEFIESKNRQPTSITRKRYSRLRRMRHV